MRFVETDTNLKSAALITLELSAVFRVLSKYFLHKDISAPLE